MGTRRKLRRLLELTAVGGVLSCALGGVGVLAQPDSLLFTLDALRASHAERKRDREEARRIGAFLENWRKEQLATVARGAEALRATRGAFLGGVRAIALDAEGRLLVGGSEVDDLHLAILRFELDGDVDEEFLRHVSESFERDTAVGGVSQIVPLEVALTQQEPFATPERVVPLSRVNAMLELPDGQLAISGVLTESAQHPRAGELGGTRPTQLLALTPGSAGPTPF